MRPRIAAYGNIDHGGFPLLPGILDDVFHSRQKADFGKGGYGSYYLRIGCDSHIRRSGSSSSEYAADVGGMIHVGIVGLPASVGVVAFKLQAQAIALHILHHPFYPAMAVCIKEGGVKGVYAYVAQPHHYPLAGVGRACGLAVLHGVGVEKCLGRIQGRSDGSPGNQRGFSAARGRLGEEA